MSELFDPQDLPPRKEKPVVPMLRSDEICLAEAAHRLGVGPKQTTKYIKEHRICRQVLKGSQIWVSAPALECLKHSDMDALELLRSGIRDDPRLERYFTLAGVPAK
jgi:hypothetical protein